MSQAAPLLSSPQRIRPRTPKVAFTEVPKHWFANSAPATHIANGVNLLFPAGERFFVRAVKRYLDRFDANGSEADAALVADIKGFFGQEGRHANAHEKFFETLRAQGYDIDAILGPYEAWEARIEKAAHPALRLSVTVALEHFTAILAEDALTEGALAYADPAMRRLFEWHALEELEHKAVAFDVLARVHPSYALRMAGLAVGATLLGGFWLFATRELLRQDGMSMPAAMRELRAMRTEAKQHGAQVPKPIFARVFVRGIREYLRPGFHPNDKDHDALVRAARARLAAEGVIDGA